MGATKFELFENDICELSALLKSISHPARLKSILLMANATDGELSTEQIQNEVGLSQSTVSYHLKQLKDAGVIDSKVVRVRNTSVQIYRLNHRAINKVLEFLELLRKKMERRYDPNYVTLASFHSKFRDFRFSTPTLSN